MALRKNVILRSPPSGRLEGRTMALQSGSVAGQVPSFRPQDPVLPVLVAVGALAVLTMGFVSVAPNRLLSGRPVGLFAAADMRLGAAIVAGATILLVTSMTPAPP